MTLVGVLGYWGIGVLGKKTRNYEPGTRNQKPGTRNQEPETMNHEPFRNQVVDIHFFVLKM